MVVFKKPANGLAVSLIPLLLSLLFGHRHALVKLHMALVAHGRYSVIVGLEAATLAIAELIAVSGHHGAITYPAILARASPNNLQ